MPNSCAAFGYATKMLVQGGNSPRTFSNTSEIYPIVGENLKAIKKLQGRGLITGSRSQFGAHLRKTTYLVRGSIVLQPGPAQITPWLQRIMWGTPSGATYPLGNSAPEFDILFNKENGIFHVKNCKVNAAVFRSVSREGEDGGQEEFVELILNIIGIAEATDTEWPGTEPSQAYTAAYLPYLHWEGAFSFGGNDTPYRNFALTINNALRPLFYNSLTPTCMRTQGRMITLQTENPFTEATFAAAYDAYETGASGTLSFTSGNMSTVFSFPALRNNYETPSIQGKGEIPLKLELEATATSSDNEMSVSHDATP
jgi:hypothetical protein